MVNGDGSEASDSRGDRSSRHVALVGEMGVGKTTVGRLLAHLLAREFIDSDELLEEEFGMTGAAYALVHGVAALHDQELRLFIEVVRTESPAAVIAPAASIIEEPSAREALSGCWVAWLRASPHVVMDRIRRGEHRRSIDSEEIRRLRNLRHGLYEGVADYEIETDFGAPDELAAELARALQKME